MARLLTTWLFLPALLLLCVSLWLSRYVSEHLDDWWPASGVLERNALSISVNTLDSRGYLRHPQIDATDIRLTSERLSVQADQLYLRLKILPSLIYLRPMVEGWINHGIISWSDQNSHTTRTHTVSNIRFKLNGTRLDARLDFDKATVVARLDLSSQGAQRAQLYASHCLSGLSLLPNRAPALLEEMRSADPEQSQCEVWVGYKKNQPIQFAVRANTDKLELGKHTFENPDTQAHGYWQDGTNWSLFLVDTQFRYHRRDYRTDVTVYRNDEQLDIHLPTFDARDAAQLSLDSDVLKQKPKDIVSRLKPQGSLHDILVRIRLGEQQLLSWNAQADLRAISLDPTHGIPGTVGTHGRVHVWKEGGYFDFASTDTQLHFAAIYEDARSYPSVSGLLYWRGVETGSRLDGLNLQVQLPDNDWVSGRFVLHLNKARDNKPSLHSLHNLDLWVNAERARIPEALRYIPTTIYRELPDWLRDSSNGGFVRDLALSADIPIDKALLDQLKMKVDAKIDDASMTVPPAITVTQGKGSFNYLNRDLRVTFEPAPVQLYGKHWTTSTIVFYKKTKGQWRVTAQAPHMAGDILYAETDAEPLKLNLEYLSLPEQIGQDIDDLDFKLLSTVVPRVRIKSERAKYGTINVEAFKLTLEFHEDKLMLTGIDFYSADKEVGSQDSQLIWTRHTDSTQSTSISGLFLFCDLKKVIRATACTSASDHHTGQLYADLIWEGSPISILTSTTLKRVSGNLRTHIKDSALMTGNHVAALKLIEFLNLTSVLWNPASVAGGGGKAIRFVVLQGRALIDSGVITVNPGDLVMIARSGEFHISGSVDLINKEVDGDIGFILPVSDNLGWVGWILGVTPVIGIGTEILRQTFKKNLDKLFTIHYRIHGPLDAIQLDRVVSPQKFIDPKDRPNLPNLEKSQSPPRPSQ